MANLIVVERAQEEAPVHFWDYFRVGLPVTLATPGFGRVWLAWAR